MELQSQIPSDIVAIDPFLMKSGTVIAFETTEGRVLSQSQAGSNEPAVVNRDNFIADAMIILESATKTKTVQSSDTDDRPRHVFSALAKRRVHRTDTEPALHADDIALEVLTSEEHAMKIGQELIMLIIHNKHVVGGISLGEIVSIEVSEPISEDYLTSENQSI